MSRVHLPTLVAAAASFSTILLSLCRAAAYGSFAGNPLAGALVGALVGASSRVHLRRSPGAR